jgi:hypothetical protein
VSDAAQEKRAGAGDSPARGPWFSAQRQLLPPGFCLACAHHESGHIDGYCDTEVKDYGEMDCQCRGLRLCAACEGDPEAHGRHICGRETL